MDEILYIPCGFRCFTKNMIRKKNKKINLQPYSLPFDNGFFSPLSIIKFIEDKECKINIENTNPCLVIKNGIWKNDKKGIEFQEVDYQTVNNFIDKNGYDNKYLDRTNGYYTLCKDYQFVLAHYNWHLVSGREITNPEKNIEIINQMFNRRKKRLFELINKSSQINLCFCDQSVHPEHLDSLPLKQRFFSFIRINNKDFNLRSDFYLLENYFKKRFKNKKINSMFL